jgi:glycosyltransferase involved in cell wall biosynthesis
LKIIGVIFTHGLRLGGIQFTVLEFIEALEKDIDFYVITCSDIAPSYLASLKTKKNVKKIFGVECGTRTRLELIEYIDINYKQALERINIDEIDFVWILDEVHHFMPHIKKMLKKKPLIAHFHSYAYICPWWGASFGFTLPCTEKCNVYRIIKCKQLINKYLSDYGFITKFRAETYKYLDYIKGPLDFLSYSRKVSEEIIKSSDLLIFPSWYSARLMLSHYQETKDFEKKMRVIYNPVKIPTEIYDALQIDQNNETNNEHVRIIYPSGFNEMKGYHVLIHSIPYMFDWIKDIHYKLELVLVGGFPRYENYEKLLHVLTKVTEGKRFKVTLMKTLPRDELLKLMAFSDLVVTPFVIPDPAPRVVVEALKVGSPVVTSKIGGAIEFVREKIDGLHVRPNDPTALSERLYEALMVGFDRKRIINENKKRFNIDIFREKFLKALEGAL